MLKHIPLGLGHPYRTEPFERTPHFPTASDQIILRVMASAEIANVDLVIEYEGRTTIIPMIPGGAAVSQDLGPFGETAKEISNDTHLQDAAMRSGEYEGLVYWHQSVNAEEFANSFNYRFVSLDQKTDLFECEIHTWMNQSDFALVANDDMNLISGTKFLTGKSGQVRKIAFDVSIAPNEKIVGFGERFNSVLQRDQVLDAVVYEEYKGQGARTYLPVPFFHALTSRFALHISTSTRTYFNIHQASGRINASVEIAPGQKELRLEFFFGDPASNLNSYLLSIGKPKAVPNWVFSLWLSSNEWNTQKRVLREVDASLASGVKPGVIVIEAWSDESTFTVFRDAKYSITNGKDGLSSKEITYPADGAWPDPKAMIDSLHDRDMKLILWQIPVIKENLPIGSQAEVNWNYAIDHDYVVKDEMGEPYKVRGFWFRGGLLPDLTNKEVRQWWAEQRRYLVSDLGVDGFKTDGGEHAWGSELRYSNQKLGIEQNNTFPVHYAQTFHELFESLNKPAVTFSRAGFTGSQAFPAFWAGDENSTWAAFRASIRAGLTASASGFFHWGWDIGGFSGDIPSAELYLRGTAMAAFCPIMQIHSEYNHHRVPSNDRTPWNLAARHGDPEILQIFARFSKLRERLIPYLADSSNHAIATGRPIMAAMFFDYGGDERIWDYQFQYMLGKNLLVCPVTAEGAKSLEIYLPSGEWFDFWTGEKFKGNSVYMIDVPLDVIPVFSNDPELTSQSLGL